MKLKIFTLAVCSFSLVATAQQKNLVRTPAISPNGNTIAFSYQGDIWTANANGSNAKRITIHEAYESNPVFTKDGNTLVFVSNRFGNNDIYSVSINGGLPKRLTYASANDVVTDVTASGEVLFGTSREFVQVDREPEIYSVNLSGGTPERIMNSLGFDATKSPNGKLIAFVKGSCRIEREAYRGPANRDVWVYNIANDSYHQITTDEGQDLSPKWADNNTLYFQSARTGKYNIHKVGIAPSGAKQGNIEAVTSYRGLGLFTFNMSADGSKLIASQADNIFIIDAASKNSTPVNLNIASDYRFDPVESKTFTNRVQEIAPSPNGKYSAVVIRGEVFVTENDKDKRRSVNISNSPYRDQSVFWLNDNVVMFTSDRDGVANLYAVSSSDATEKDIFKSLKHKVTKVTSATKEISNPVLSHNGKQIAYNEGRGKLIVASIDENGKISNRKTLVDNGWNAPSGVSWSPDNKWLAYSQSNLDFNSEVFIHKADGSMKPVNISMHPKADSRPMWSPDGSKLAFASNRNNSDYDVWFVWLKKADWEKTPQDWEEEDGKEKPKKAASTDKNGKKDTAKKPKVADIVIDFEDIYQRQVQVTNYTGGEFLQAISKDGKTFYYTTGNGTRENFQADTDLYKIDWNRKNKKAITKGNSRPSNLVMDKKYSYLYLTRSGRPNRIKLAGDKMESIGMMAKMKIDYYQEQDQIFEEAWNAINDGFYDPNFHGQDWNALKKTYKPLAMKASTRDDFKWMFNNMLGQINASHMGMYSGENRADVQRQSTGQLGIEVKSQNNGIVKVTHVTENMPASKQASTLQVGTIITAVNGVKLTKDTNFYSLFDGTANEKIYLTTTTPSGTSAEVVIRPTFSNRTAKYEAWVKERKRLTNKYSNGRLGYIHIQGMNWTSFERFERELMAAGHGKEGVVIDVRYNGGGWTTDYLMAVLNVKQHAYTVPRGAAKNLEKEHTKFKNHYPFSERLPLASWTKPSVALCNERSYSNAEIFSHAYKALGLGTLVGQPTFGAVISTGGRGLIDGSYVRMPFRGWYVKDSESNMELGPAVPDVLIKNAPDEKAKGTDTQLKKAVDVLLQQIGK
jgi:C-terminal processing protease CtpA/Prc